MLAQVQGTINGKHIELNQEVDLPPGSKVLVSIKPKPLSLGEKGQLIDSLCGAWADDPSLEPLFADIEHRRTLTIPRDVNFDATS